MEEHPELYPMMERPGDISNVLVVSLGCGIQAQSSRPGFTADEANKWSSLNWVSYQDRKPLLEFVSDGAMDTLDYYIFSLFKAYNAERNYIRVQVYIQRFLDHSFNNYMSSFEVHSHAHKKKNNPTNSPLEYYHICLNPGSF